MNDARSLWDIAYEDLKNDNETRELVDEYEEILLAELHPNNKTQIEEPSVEGWSEKIRREISTLNDNDRQMLLGRLCQNGIKIFESHPNGLQLISATAEFTKKTKEVVGSALSACPAASMAWAGVCLVVLPAVLNNAEQIYANQAGLTYVLSRLPWYIQLTDLLNADAWRDHTNFHQLREIVRLEIIQLYKALIEYQLRTLHSYRHLASTFTKNLIKWDGWDTMIVNIKSMEAELDKRIVLCHQTNIQDKLSSLLQEASRSRETLNSLLQRQFDTVVEQLQLQKRQLDVMELSILNNRRNEIIGKFKFDPIELRDETYQDYFDRIEKPHQSTNSGIIGHHTFQRWVAADTGVLILTAHPGTGKSVLAKHLLSELLKRQNTIVCSFFFKDNNTGQNKATIALCNILYELFQHSRHLVDSVEDDLGGIDKDRLRSSVESLWDILEKAIQAVEKGNVILVLDAIDECDSRQRHSLLKVVREHFNRPDRQLKILLTTRPLEAVLEEFQDEHVINLDDDDHCVEALRRDIVKVIHTRFNDFTRSKHIKEESTKKALLEHLLSYKNQTYLYVKLVFEFLDKVPRPRMQRKWLETFKALPSTVYETYQGFLNKIHPNDRSDLKLMLELVLAAVRPLTVKEMNIALNIRDQTQCQMEADLDLQQESDFKAWIYKTCHFFLHVSDGRIYFIHQTAKEFLLRPTDGTSCGIPDWLGQFSMQSCHEGLAESCLAYLTAPFVAEMDLLGIHEYCRASVNSRLRHHYFHNDKLKFSEYSFSNWFRHCQESRKFMKFESSMILVNGNDKTFEVPFDVAIRTFCCVASPSATEVKAFLDFLPLDLPDRGDIVHCLSCNLAASFQQTGHRANLECAIQIIEEACIRAPENDHHHIDRLTSLSLLLGDRFELSGDIGDLERGIDIGHMVVRLAIDDDPLRSRYLRNLALCLCKRFDRKGCLSDLEEAIELSQESVKAAQYDYPEWPESLKVFSVLKGKRFDRTGQMSAIGEAIESARKTLVSVAGDHPDRPDYMKNLGGLLVRRYSRTDNRQDLEEAIQLACKALNGLPLGHPSRPELKRNLGIWIRHRFGGTGNISDLEEAIDLGFQALDQLPIDHSNRPSYLQDVAISLLHRFKRTDNMGDLEKAVTLGRQALDRLPSDHPN
ncbi:hypothetical protein BDV32DRAFT_150646, partial [Aspergillus pseudonomiae]